MVRVVIPFHLQTLSSCDKEQEVSVEGAVTVRSIIHALEQRFPMLSGTIIDHYSGERRPKVRLFACGEDVSLDSLDKELPKPIAAGEEPLLVVGAISGG